MGTRFVQIEIINLICFGKVILIKFEFFSIDLLYSR